jgi:hypothetical protein
LRNPALAALEGFLQQLPDGTPAADHPWRFVDAVEVLPALDEVWRAGGDQIPERVVIVSPFWPLGEEAEAPVVELLRRLKGAGRLELVCEGAATPDGKGRLPVLPPALTNRLRQRIGCPLFLRPCRPDVGVGGSAEEDAGDRNEDDELAATTPRAEAIQRALHAKMIVVQGKQEIVLYAGSSNCTRRGLGLGAEPNWEAGFVYRLGKRQAPLVDKLLAPAGPPVEVLPDGAVVIQAPVQEPEEPVPAFLREVVAAGNKVFVHFRNGVAVPPDLTLLMRDVSALEGERYWLLLGPGLPQGLNGSYLVSLEECPRCDANLQPAASAGARQGGVPVPHVEVEVRWSGNVGYFPVRFDDKTALPPVLLGRRPTEGELIDYFVLGRQPGEGSVAGIGDDGEGHVIRDLRIDTRRILTYFIRRFVQAIPGMEAELDRAAYSRPSLRAALFGPTSPVSLAQQAYASLSRPADPDEPRKTPIAVGFQLVEITAALLRCRARATQDEFRALYDQAVTQCRGWLDALKENHPGLSNGPFALYRRTFAESTP